MSKAHAFVTGLYAPGRDRVPVWSRTASSITLHYGSPTPTTVSMEREGNWWFSPISLPDGTDYAFSIDGADPVADPRAVRRPDGVHGVARTWRPPSPVTYDAGDLCGRVFYEMHVGTFTPEGTFDAAIDKLDHLQSLGVEVVEVMPVASFPGAFGWGYDGVSLYSTQETYGGPDAFRRFIDAAHSRGLAVCLDVVLNHFGPVGNYIAGFDDYYSHTHETPWGPAFDLDGDNRAHVRAFLIGVALYWLEDMGVDALRLDAVHALADDSDYHLLAELADAVADAQQRSGRTFTLIAESDLNDPVMVTPTSHGGRGMDGQWDDDLHHSIHSLFTGEAHGYYGDFAQRDAIVKAFSQVFFHDGSYSTFRGQNWGAPVSAATDRRRFVAFSQNHDQVGNRALGDRPAAVLTDAQLGAQAALILLSPFTPMLFQGEEWASRSPFLFFSDQEGDPAMARAMRDGRRAEFASHGWDEIYGHAVEVPDPTDRRTFEKSKLDWKEAHTESGQHMMSWYRQLLSLRHRQRCITDGNPVAMQWDGDVLFMRRPGGLQIAVNFGSTVEIDDVDEVLLSWSQARRTNSRVTLNQFDTLVFRSASNA
ncbi:MAG: malto-oligosyltrehalose trehalohydrolase [Actinomycetaceae bacterium]|nr:malto-oligosyltrehalose trehalohydrolase [Actinomycetaceae bacterium]